MLATLRTYQDRVLAIANEADALLAGTGAAALPRVAQLWLDEGVATAAYQLFVHRELFLPLSRDGTPTQVEAVRRLKVECILFANDFCRYVQDWTRRDPAAEWAGYLPEARAMAARIRAHVGHVQAELAPALDRLGRPAAAG